MKVWKVWFDWENFLKFYLCLKEFGISWFISHGYCQGAEHCLQHAQNSRSFHWKKKRDNESIIWSCFFYKHTCKLCVWPWSLKDTNNTALLTHLNPKVVWEDLRDSPPWKAEETSHRQIHWLFWTQFWTYGFLWVLRAGPVKHIDDFLLLWGWS